MTSPALVSVRLTDRFQKKCGFLSESLFVLTRTLHCTIPSDTCMAKSDNLEIERKANSAIPTLDISVRVVQSQIQKASRMFAGAEYKINTVRAFEIFVRVRADLITLY